MKVTIYTDGGSDPNPGIGGWAAILRAGGREKVLTGNAPHTTNNRMELTATIEALQALTRPSEIDFYLDSQYVRRGISEWIKGWAARGWIRKDGQPVPNADLWQALWPLTKEHEIEWHWVKGHSGNRFNERVDKLARKARLEITPGIDISKDAPRVYMRASCLGNPGLGAWAVVVESPSSPDSTTQFSGVVEKTTNNRMEITAAIEALEHLPNGSDAQLFTVSDYLFQGATNWIKGWRNRGWKKRDGKPVANGDLWKHLDKLFKQHDVRWINAKGKSLQGMEEAGRLAADIARMAAPRKKK